MTKIYRSTILFPLGFENGKPVPTPQGLGDDFNSPLGYTKTGTHRENSGLKPFKENNNAFQIGETKKVPF